MQSKPVSNYLLVASGIIALTVGTMVSEEQHLPCLGENDSTQWLKTSHNSKKCGSDLYQSSSKHITKGKEIQFVINK